MRNITMEGLNTILKNHKHWLNKDIEGWENMRADLSDVYWPNVDLRGADLRYANLSNAYLYQAKLRRANLSNANLKTVDLNSADLRYANLSNADLFNATLCDANLNGAHLNHASLICVNFEYADLSGADLSDANLDRAVLDYAHLCDADLSDANLNRVNALHTNLCDAINVPYIPMTCPDTGAFIGWKKCKYGIIVKLLIPEDAKRSSATGRKCRCDKAVVLDIEGADIAYSCYDNDFVYRKGETVTAEDFDNDRFVECGTGIHFFISRQEAINYK